LVFLLPAAILGGLALFVLDDEPLIAAVKSGQLVSVAFSMLATRLLMHAKASKVGAELRAFSNLVVVGGAVFVALYTNLPATEKAALPSRRVWLMLAVQAAYALVAGVLTAKVESELTSEV